MHADHRAHVDQLGEERVVERALEKRHAGGSSRTRLVPDDPLDGLHVTEPPEQKAFFYVDELLAHVIGVPPMSWVVVYRLEYRHEIGMSDVRLTEIPFQTGSRHRQ